MRPRTWNDVLAAMLLGLIPSLWYLNGRGWIELDDAVSGGLIAAFTLVVQFYFRRSPGP